MKIRGCRLILLVSVLALLPGCGAENESSTNDGSSSGEMSFAESVGSCPAGSTIEPLPPQLAFSPNDQSWFRVHVNLQDGQIPNSLQVAGSDVLSQVPTNLPTPRVPDASILVSGAKPLSDNVAIGDDIMRRFPAAKASGLSDFLVASIDGKTVRLLGAITDDSQVAFIGDCMLEALTEPLRLAAQDQGVSMLQEAIALIQRSNVKASVGTNPPAAAVSHAPLSWTALSANARQLSPDETPASVYAALRSATLTIELPSSIRTDRRSSSTGICVKLVVAWAECATLEAGLVKLPIHFEPGNRASLWLISDDRGFASPIGKVGDLPPLNDTGAIVGKIAGPALSYDAFINSVTSRSPGLLELQRG